MTYNLVFLTADAKNSNWGLPPAKQKLFDWAKLPLDGLSSHLPSDPISWGCQGLNYRCVLSFQGPSPQFESLYKALLYFQKLPIVCKCKDKVLTYKNWNWIGYIFTIFNIVITSRSTFLLHPLPCAVVSFLYLSLIQCFKLPRAVPG